MPKRDADNLMDNEAEQMLLSACLGYRDAVDVALEELEPEHFGFPNNREVFVAILALAARDSAIDQITVADQLRQQGKLETIGGLYYLATLASQASTGGNARYHARIIKDKASARALVDIVRQTEQRILGGESATELIQETDARMLDLVDGGGTQAGPRHISKVLEETMEALQERLENPGAITGVSSGYGAIDSITAGWQGGDLVIIGGRTSQGKTALGACLALNAATQDNSVAIFSTEQRATQINERLLANLAGVNLIRIRQGRMTPGELDLVTSARRRLATLPIHLDDSTGMSPQIIAARTRRLIRQYGIRLVVVDYLQYLRWPEQTHSREQEVAKISRSLKDLAKQLNIPIIALAQISREVDKRAKARPVLADLRESGSIEQDADVVIFVHRPEVYGIEEIEVDGQQRPSKGLAEIIIAKQRSGPTGDVLMRWEGTLTRFDEILDEFQLEFPNTEGSSS